MRTNPRYLGPDPRPNPTAAGVCKVWLRYAKRDKLRFASHRDVARAFERALRRTGLPVAYSQGYHPHPKVSWGGAAPTGAASAAEYVEIQFTAMVDPEVVRAGLDAALPGGLAVLNGGLAGSGGLAGRLEVSRWRIELPGIGPEQLRHAVQTLLATGQVVVERVTKDGRRSIDARAAIVALQVEDQPVRLPNHDHLPGCGILTAVVRQVSPAVRPDDVLSALGVVAGLQPPVPARVTRMAQGRLDDDGGLVEPLAPARASASALVSVEPGGGEPDLHGVARHAS